MSAPVLRKRCLWLVCTGALCPCWHTLQTTWQEFWSDWAGPYHCTGEQENNQTNMQVWWMDGWMEWWHERETEGEEVGKKGRKKGCHYINNLSHRLNILCPFVLLVKTNQEVLMRHRNTLNPIIQFFCASTCSSYGEWAMWRSWEDEGTGRWQTQSW